MSDIRNSKICIIILLFIISCKSQVDKDVDEVRKLFQNDRYEEAIQLASKSIEKYPNDARLYYNRGYCYLGSSDKKAMDDFTNCIRIDPNYHNGYYGLAMVYEAEKEFDLAEKNYNKALDLAPDNERKATFLGGLSSLLFKKRDYKKAIETQRKSIELDGRSDRYLNLGWYLSEDGQSKEAELMWLKGIEKNTFGQIDFKHKTYGSLARYYFQEKNFQKAKENIEKAIELSPNNKMYMDLYKKNKKFLK